MMKKILCLFLCAVMVLPILTGCNLFQKGLKVGYGRADVTPTDKVWLGGLGDMGGQRITSEVWDPLYVTCTAFTDDNENTVLLYHMDILNTYDVVYKWIPNISEATGVPEDNIILSATHNHSAPNMEVIKTDYTNEYKVLFLQALINSAKDALEDRAVAEMYITSCNPENMTFVRHYRRKDGSVHGWGGNADEAAAGLYTGHAAEADNDFQMIKFVRKGKKDVLLVNWQGHPRAHGESVSAIQSDVDVLRKRLEADMDCLFAFFLGGSGNQNNSSVIPAEQRSSNYKEHYNILADEALEAAKNFTKVQTGNVKVIKETSLQARTNGKSSTIPMTVFSIGDVAFLSAGYEMFGTSAMELKEYSSFKMTFIVTCSNGDFKYMPTLATYKFEGAYETSSATLHVKGTAEKLVEKYKTMLDQLAAE